MADDPAADRQRSRVQRIYNQDSDYYVTSRPHARSASLERAVALLAPRGGLLLDVATGAGHTALAMAPHCRRVVASDLTQGMLVSARRLARERGVQNASFLRADAESLPVRSHSLDHLSVRIAPHHFAEPRRFLAEAARVLKPGGALIYVDNTAPADPAAAAAYNAFERRRDPSHHRCDAAETLGAWIEELGLEVLHTEMLRKRIVFANWVRRPNLDDDDRHELEQTLRSAAGPLREWLEPREDEEGLVFDEVEAVILARSRGHQTA